MEKQIEGIRKVNQALLKYAEKNKRQVEVYHLWAYTIRCWRMLGKFEGYNNIKEIKKEPVYEWLKLNKYNIVITQSKVVEKE